MLDTPQKTVLLVESDVIIRMMIAAHLRACSYVVIETLDGAEAKAVMQAGSEPAIVLAEAQSPGGESGFSLAQWVRRYRPNVDVILSSSLESKTETASELCARFPDITPPSNGAGLLDRIKAMIAERRRRTKPSTLAMKPKRRRRLS